MVMKVFRIVPAVNAPQIICTTCGEKADQAGIGVRPEAIQQGRDDADIPMTFVDMSAAKSLCDACLRLLLSGVTRNPSDAGSSAPTYAAILKTASCPATSRTKPRSWRSLAAMT
jgi:hypothetical protein